MMLGLAPLLLMMVVIMVIMLIMAILARVVTFMIFVVMMLGHPLEMRLEFAVALLGGQRADLHVDVATSQFGLLVTLPHGLEVLLDLGGEFMAEFLVSHLAAAELQLDSHLMTFREEILGMGDLDEVVMGVDADTELEFLNLAALLMLVSLFLVFLLDVFELAVVDDFAHRRIGLRSNLHEIETALSGDAQCLVHRQDSELVLTVLLDDAHLGGADSLVDTIKFVRMTAAITITVGIAPRPASSTTKRAGWRTTLPGRAGLGRPGGQTARTRTCTHTGRTRRPRSTGTLRARLPRTLL